MALEMMNVLKGDKGLYPQAGEYDPDRSYRQDSLVKVGNTQWRSKKAVPPGHPPAEDEYWSVFIDGQVSLDAAGVASAAAATATSAAGTATTQAGLAAAQAGIATNKAADATTQAGVATTQAGVSTTQALAAANAAVQGQGFRDAAGGYLASVSATALNVAALASSAQNAAAAATNIAVLTGLGGYPQKIASYLTTNGFSTIYWDTSQDDDGGAWRENLQASYITGGPLNSVWANGIVAGALLLPPRLIKVEISATLIRLGDGDDPLHPLWRSIPRGSTASADVAFWHASALMNGTLNVSAKDGMLAVGVGTTGGVQNGILEFDFAGDRLARRSYGVNGGQGFNFASRFDIEPLPVRIPAAEQLATSTTVMYIDMVRAAMWPRDRSRGGMPRPIILATGTQCTAVCPDGITCANTTSGARTACFDADGNIVEWYNSSALYITPPSIYLNGNWSNSAAGVRSIAGAQMLSGGIAAALPRTLGDEFFAFYQTSGGGTASATLLAQRSVTLFQRDRRWANNLPIANIGSNWNTGWVPAPQFLKACLAEGTNDLGSFTSAEILPNPSFATDLSGWNSTSSAGASVPTWDAGNGGRAALPNVTIGTNIAVLNTPFNVIPGRAYKLTATGSAAGLSIQVGTVVNTADLVNTSITAGATGNAYFQAPTGFTTVYVRIYSTTAGTTGYLDDISIKAVLRDIGAPSTIKPVDLGAGVSLTKAAVASGSEVSWFVGPMSATNNIPLGLRLNALGTGEFILQGFAMAGASASGVDEVLWANINPAGTGARLRLYVENATGFLRFEAHDGTTSFLTSATASSNRLGLGLFTVIVQRVGNMIQLWVNNVLEGTVDVTTAQTLTTADAVVTLGNLRSGDTAFWRGNVGSIFACAAGVAYTREQIAQWHHTLWGMCQANARSMLINNGSPSADIGTKSIGYDPVNKIFAVPGNTGVAFFNNKLLRIGIFDSAAQTDNLLPGGGSSGSWLTPSNVALSAASPSAPLSWGDGTRVALTENNANTPHYVQATSYTAPVGDTIIAVRIWPGSRTSAVVYSVGNSMVVNLSTGATSGAVACTPLPSIMLADGSVVAQYKYTGAGAATLPRVYANQQSGYVGDNGASGPAVYVGAMMVRAGSSAFTVNDFAFGTSRSNVSIFNLAGYDGNWSIPNALGFDTIVPAVNVRARVVSQPAWPANDNSFMSECNRSTNVTPFILGRIQLGEGRSGTYRVTVSAAQEGTGTEVFQTTFLVTAARVRGGALVVTMGTQSVGTAGTVGGVTATASADNRAIIITATGKAATTLIWEQMSEAIGFATAA